MEINLQISNLDAYFLIKNLIELLQRTLFNAQTIKIKSFVILAGSVKNHFDKIWPKNIQFQTNSRIKNKKFYFIHINLFNLDNLQSRYNAWSETKKNMEVVIETKCSHMKRREKSLLLFIYVWIESHPHTISPDKKWDKKMKIQDFFSNCILCRVNMTSPDLNQSAGAQYLLIAE